jgi:hypothetical protein
MTVRQAFCPHHMIRGVTTDRGASASCDDCGQAWVHWSIDSHDDDPADVIEDACDAARARNARRRAALAYVAAGVMLVFALVIFVYGWTR